MNKPQKRKKTPGQIFVRVMAFILCALLILSVLIMIPATAVHAATTLESLQSKQKSLKTEQTKLDAEIASLKQKESSEEAYQASLKLKISNAKEQSENLKQQLTLLENSIAEKQTLIAEKQSNIDADFAQLRERLKMLYMFGEVSTLKMILVADSAIDYFNRSEFAGAITMHDNSIIEELKEQSAAIEQEKSEIEDARNAVEEIKTERERQLADLNYALSESKRVSASIDQKQAAAAQRQKQINAEQAKVDAEITQWWKDYYAEQKKKQTATITSTGTFMWPLPGYSSKANITQYFGGSNAHRGIDISGASVYGKAIVAADSGVVAQTATNNSIYGIYLTIDHGKNIATLYGHCSGLAVKAGQTVKKGQTIAYVGSSGVSTGAHLHFGVLVNGTPVNPLNYFKL